MEIIAKPIKGMEQFGVTKEGCVVRLVDSSTGGHRAGKVYKAVHTTTSPYLYVKLCSKNTPRGFSVHRLVASSYLDNPHNLPEVNHKDGNKFNNHVDNLEWVTRSTNSLHAFRQLGRTGPRERVSPRCAVLDSDVPLMHKMRAEGATYKAIGASFSISQVHASRLVNGKRRGWLTPKETSV